MRTDGRTLFFWQLVLPGKDRTMVDDIPREMHPDQIAHVLVTSEGEAVRIHLADEPNVPLDPIPERGGYETASVEVRSFDAQVDRASIEDAGETLFAQLHLPAGEWEKLRLHEHWEKDEAEDWREEKYMESWANRFDNEDDYDPDEYESPVPEDSPIRTAIKENRFDIDSPRCPYSRPTLNFDAATAKSVMDYGNAWTRQELGEIHAVERLEESLNPQERDKEDPRDIEPPSRPDRPTIEFDELEPLEPSEDLLDAVHAINRHAKRLDKEADNKYNRGQGAEAKVASIRKDALYATKTVAIHRFLKAEPEVDVLKHNLNGDVDMFLFDFGRVSFHQPPRAVIDDVFEEIDAVPDKDGLTAEEIEFSPSSETDSLRFSLEEAVAKLRGVGIDPDSYLRSTTVEDYTFNYQIVTRFD